MKPASFLHSAEAPCFCPFLGKFFTSLLLGFIVLFAPQNASADVIVKTQVGNLGLAVVADGDDLYELRVQGPSSSGNPITPQIMLISNPPRLVVDILNTPGVKNQTLKVEDPNIFRVRIGAHEGKGRIVCDLKPNVTSTEEIRYVWQRDPIDGAVVIKFSILKTKPRINVERTPVEPRPTSTPRRTPMPTPTLEVFEVEEPPMPPPTPMFKPVPTATRTAMPTPVAIPTATATRALPTPTATATLVPTPKPTPTAKPGPKKMLSLMNISFKKTGDTGLPSAVFRVPGIMIYNLEKVEPDMYELTLPNVVIGQENLLAPGIPPEEFAGIEMVVPRVENSDIKIKIFVTEGETLIPFILGDELWVKETGRAE